MQKVIFLGTDLHEKPSELASKLVRDLTKNLKKHVILSIQNQKIFSSQKRICIIPRVSKNEYARKIIQAILLPLYLLVLRAKYRKIFTFWTINGKYHYFLFKFLKSIKYQIIFTVISGYDKDYCALRFCDKILCQSERMRDYLRKLFPKKDIRILRPWADLRVFRPGEKKDVVLIPSTPYKVKYFDERGIYEITEILKEGGIKSIVLVRSNEAYQYFRKSKKIEIINKILDDKELANLMSFVKILPLIYSKNAPDVPLSAIEGLASGCAIICTKNLGLSDTIKEGGGGIVVNSNTEISKAIERIFKNAGYNKNARITAEKYFDKEKNIRRYFKLINE